MSSAAAGEVIIRAFRPGDEEALVALLNASFSRPWGDVDHWRAKHAERPGFSTRHTVVAECEGRLVGCLHCTVVSLRLGPGVVVAAAIDGDLAVHPEKRGGGVAEALYAFSSEGLLRDGVVLRMGYSGAGPRLGFYTRVLGYVAGFEDLRAYRKVIDPDLLRDRLRDRLGIAPELPGEKPGPIVEVAVAGLPAFRMQLGRAGIAFVKETAARSALRIETDQRVFELFGAGGTNTAVLRLLRQRVVRVKGTPIGFARVAYWVLARRLRARAAST